MNASLRAALAAGALALAASSASASTVNLTSGSTVQAGDFLPGWMQINVGAGVTGAKFVLADSLNDGYTVDYQLYQADQLTTVGAGFQFTDIGSQAQNLAQTAVYRALSAGTYFLKITFANPDAGAYGASTQVSAVPLPGAALLFGSALMGFGALRRKQKAGGKSEMAAV